MLRALAARAPTRLDFGGGWTDVPPYSEREGGVVCNVAITRYATARVSRDDAPAPPTTDPLVRAALDRSGLVGVSAALTSDFPVGAGLGGSSAAGVALAGALAALQGRRLPALALAALSRATEVDGLGVAGGFQDHYVAALGGALLLTFADCVGAEQIALAPGTAAELAERGVLVYTGESRISGETITAVVDGYLAGATRVCDALARMKALAVEMAAALRAGDVSALGMLIGEHWVHQRALHRSITTPRIDAIVSAAARVGALGVKALGASGGGCVLAIAAPGRERELALALAPFGERLEYAIDTRGFQLLSAEDASSDDAHAARA